jgi:hypothetical protein
MSRTLCAVSTSVILVLSVADGVASASDRADARRLIAPMAGVERVVERDASKLETLGVAWGAVVAPCLREGYAGLERAAAEQTITPGEQETFGWVMFATAMADAAVELSGPLDRALATAQRQFARMRIGDRVLRAGARAKARQLATLRAHADIDTCRVIEQWSAAAFSLLELPDDAIALLADDMDKRVLERAGRRLRRLGISRERVDTFGVFPLAAVAAPALIGEVRPPVG